MTHLSSRMRTASANIGRSLAELRGSGSLPGFIVIGAERCGTTSFFMYLRQHHAVAAPVRKEVHFFDRNSFHRGVRHYRSFFPNAARMARRGEFVTGEATPGYVFHPLAAERIATTLPNSKFILLLRDPVERARSHHALQTRRGIETLRFEDALEAEASRLDGHEERMLTDPYYCSTDYVRYSYLARGDYARQLERWFEHIDRRRLLVIVSEECFADPARWTACAEEFLGLPSPATEFRFPKVHATTAVEMDPSTRAELRTRFAPIIERTEQLIGRKLPWPRSG
jgi:hypothetical protein